MIDPATTQPVSMLAAQSLFALSLFALGSCVRASPDTVPAMDWAVPDGAVDMPTVMKACRAFAVNNNGRFPDNLDVLVMRDSTGAAYLEAATAPVMDIWGTPYTYQLEFNSSECRVVSLGKDGVPGGLGVNQDVVRTLAMPRR